MAFSPEARRLLAALRRGEIVSRGQMSGWTTSGGEVTEGASVYALVRAGYAEYFEWGPTSRGGSIGIKARLAPKGVAHADDSAPRLHALRGSPKRAGLTAYHRRRDAPG